MKKSLKNIFVNNHTISLFTTGINMLLNGFGFWLFIRTYSKADIGQWIIYTSGLQLIEMFRSGLLFTGLVKFLSGSNSNSIKREKMIGATWILSLASTAIISTFSYLIFLIFRQILIQKGFLLFFRLFPISFIASIPVSISITVLVSRQNFLKILVIKIGSTIPSVIFMVLNYFIFKFNIYTATLINIFTLFPIAIYCLADGSSGIQYIFKASKKMVMKILNYGKYSMFTLLAVNLLRSSDVYIIGLFLTNIEVANYGIPLKIIALIESVLNSFSDVAMPAISKEANLNNIPGIRRLFYKYSGLVTILIVPITILFMIFANFFLWIIGGSRYLDCPDVYYVLSIFILSFLIHPVDRFTGITLDSINKPGMNLFKVFIMVLINIIGDIIVIVIFKSIVSVALITLLNVTAGTTIGLIFLKKQIGVRLKDFFSFIAVEIRVFFKFRIKKS